MILKINKLKLNIKIFILNLLGIEVYYGNCERCKYKFCTHAELYIPRQSLNNPQKQNDTRCKERHNKSIFNKELDNVIHVNEDLYRWCYRLEKCAPAFSKAKAPAKNKAQLE